MNFFLLSLNNFLEFRICLIALISCYLVRKAQDAPKHFTRKENGEYNI